MIGTICRQYPDQTITKNARTIFCSVRVRVRVRLGSERERSGAAPLRSEREQSKSKGPTGQT